MRWGTWLVILSGISMDNCMQNKNLTTDSNYGTSLLFFLVSFFFSLGRKVVFIASILFRLLTLREGEMSCHRSLLCSSNRSTNSGVTSGFWQQHRPQASIRSLVSECSTILCGCALLHGYAHQPGFRLRHKSGISA